MKRSNHSRRQQQQQSTTALSWLPTEQDSNEPAQQCARVGGFPEWAPTPPQTQQPFFQPSPFSAAPSAPSAFASSTPQHTLISPQHHLHEQRTSNTTSPSASSSSSFYQHTASGPLPLQRFEGSSPDYELSQHFKKATSLVETDQNPLARHEGKKSNSAFAEEQELCDSEFDSELSFLCERIHVDENASTEFMPYIM
ncbi:hypothetical protein QOT17_013651 [Balamuthia mandrillaris]